jgi:hypothetical protein
MSFREKRAWISFVVVLMAFGAYSVSISGDLSVPVNISHHAATLVGLLAVAVTVVEIAAHILVALSSPSEAHYYRRGLG